MSPPPRGSPVLEVFLRDTYENGSRGIGNENIFPMGQFAYFRIASVFILPELRRETRESDWAAVISHNAIVNANSFLC